MVYLLCILIYTITKPIKINMNNIAIYKKLKNINKNIFKTSDLKRIFNIANINSLNKKIQSLVKNEILIKIMKGYYYLTDKKPLVFEIANILYKPSYISLESALCFYGILIQSPQKITSVTTKLTKKITSNKKRFVYYKINNKYFKEYVKINDFLIATPEKAFIDYIYFSSFKKRKIDISELNLKKLNKKKVNYLASQIQSRTFQKYFNKIQK